MGKVFVLLATDGCDTLEICGVTASKEKAEAWTRLDGTIQSYRNMAYGKTIWPRWAEKAGSVSEKTYDSFPKVFTTERLREYARKKLAEHGDFYSHGYREFQCE